MTDPAPAAVARLVACYERAARNMRDLPMYHGELEVEAVGFREHAGRLVGVIVTPWFMNLTILPSPADLATWRQGELARFAFPSGSYEFVVSEAAADGLIATCSLFSLMHDFTDHADARAAALAAVDALFEPQAGPEPVEPPPVSAMSRRRFLRGGQ